MSHRRTDLKVIMQIQKVRLLALFILVLLIQTSRGDSLTVLFLGNSHTFMNNVPQLTADLALSNNDTLFFEVNAPGGCTLGHPDNGHLYNSTSLALIDSMAWDYVILQEQSLFAVIDYYRDTYMYPGAKSLDSLIKLNNECTETIVQIIWGKKYGGQYCMNSHCSVDFVDFAHMQDSLTSEYLRLGDTLLCTLSPAGVAWQQSIINGDPIELFSADESHSSPAGAYLSACVHYAILFQKSPVGLTFTGGLSLQDALYFQQIANAVVFSEPDIWNLNSNKPIAGFETMQLGNAIFFSDTSINANHFNWDFGDGTTDTVQNPIHNYTTSGTYTITQEVSDGCHSDITSNTITITVTSFSEYTNSSQAIRIIHNRSLKEISITSTKSNIQEINIYGLSGNLALSEKEVGTQKHLLAISTLNSGFYILVVRTEDGINTFKFIIP